VFTHRISASAGDVGSFAQNAMQTLEVFHVRKKGCRVGMKGRRKKKTAPTFDERKGVLRKAHEGEKRGRGHEEGARVR